jgi:hypothetical protein
MKKSCYTLLICLALAGCGTFQAGPVDPSTGQAAPSPFKIGLTEAAETYDESPWSTFGPWGAGIAGLLAAAAGIKKGQAVLKARKENE